jgi:hypothetical protein
LSKDESACQVDEGKKGMPFCSVVHERFESLELACGLLDGSWACKEAGEGR